jgi:hypothetical protein
VSEVVGVGCEIHITQMYQLTADGLIDGFFVEDGTPFAFARRSAFFETDTIHWGGQAGCREQRVVCEIG